MTEIQKARDVLAKWREYDTSRWIVNTDTGDDAYSISIVAPSIGAAGDVARLILGTAGNPELLDAIDGLLTQEQRRRTTMHDNMSSDLSHHATRIAAAIIAADERLSAAKEEQ